MDSLPSTPVPDAIAAPEPLVTPSLAQPWSHLIWRRTVATLRYLMHTEVHTFAFSVAANAILSFFPFVVVMTWLVRGLFHSQMMFQALLHLIRDQLPAGQDIIVNNLSRLSRHVKIASIVLLLISSSGVFLPLEVAFNRIWGFARNRSYLANQLVSLGLVFGCGLLALLSTAFTAGNEYILQILLINDQNIFYRTAFFLMLKLFATLTSITIFFFIYWILPNGKVSAKSVMPAAAAMGVLWEVSKYLYMLALPWLNFRDVYGPFVTSVTLMFWAFLSGLMVLAGANLAAIGAADAAAGLEIGAASASESAASAL
jgi:membrane protein